MMWRAFVLNCPSHDTLEPCRADVNNIRGTLGRFAAPGAGTNPEQRSPPGGRPASKVRWRLWLASGNSGSPLMRPSMPRWI